jgi:FtsP/CotA-like multicopper oxidase with cupredoxin domain
MDELNAEAESDLQVDMNFNGTAPTDLTLINGLSRPTLNIVNKNPSIFKIINAGMGRPLHITLPSSSVSCEGVVIAVDGVYLQSRWERTTVNIPAGGRVDLEIFCDFVGTYTIYESGKPFFYARISQSSSNRPPVKDAQLEAIRRPKYMDDLRVQNVTTIDRYFTVDMSLRPADTCSYQIGFGMNCLNETIVYDENATYPQYDYDCTYDSWTGSHGIQPFDYVLSNRFVTFEDALNQWTIYGGGTAYQTFSMRVHHFQIMSMDSNQTENDWFRIGQYRDTLPMVERSVVIRFISADFTGENTFQSDFVRHKELGVKDSYLVVNFSTFQSLTQYPTQAPTDTPNGKKILCDGK